MNKRSVFEYSRRLSDRNRTRSAPKKRKKEKNTRKNTIFGCAYACRRLLSFNLRRYLWSSFQLLYFEPEKIMILLTPSSGFFQCTNKRFLSDEATGLQIKEFARKNAANALSMTNMVMGMASILSSLNGLMYFILCCICPSGTPHHHAACWLVLIGYLLDLADGAVARRLDACSALGAKLDDFADFTTFGIATSLLLRTSDLLDNILCMCYVLSVFVRLCFFSSGIPFMYRGLPCIYSSAILSSASLLSGGNMALLRVIAVAMILFMISQNFYPHDRVLESQAWKKVVYAGGVVMVFCSFFPPACVYYLLWSVSYILFPTSLWSSKV